ncbi:MAG TPA: CcmD family protein [Actinomycetota bacterium]|nr:CcmD family protein [Actinomycetota bacterium]
MKGGLGYLGLAFIVVWAAIGCYLIILDRRQRAIDRRLEQLQAAEQRPGD